MKQHIRLNGMFFCCLLVFCACAGKPYAVAPETKSGNHTPLTVIHVSNHGWHTGLIIPAENINERLPALRQRFGQVPYYEFGWGDAGYYRAERVTSGLLLSAVVWPTDAVLHVVAVDKDPQAFFAFSEIVELTVTGPGLDHLIDYIVSSFTKDDGGGLHPLGIGIYGDSEFYQAEGKYFLTNTCNTWTAKGLKSTGRDICASSKLTAGSIRRYLKRE